MDATLKRHVDREGNATEFLYETIWPNCGLAYQETRYLNGVPKVWQYLNWKITGYQPRRVRTIDPDGRRSLVGMDWTYDEVLYTDVDPVNDPYANYYGQPSYFPGALGLQTKFLYNAQGELTDTWMGNDPHAVSSSFDAYGNAQTVTDPSGNTTLLTYDAWGNKNHAERTLAPRHHHLRLRRLGPPRRDDPARRRDPRHDLRRQRQRGRPPQGGRHPRHHRLRRVEPPGEREPAHRHGHPHHHDPLHPAR